MFPCTIENWYKFIEMEQKTTGQLTFSNIRALLLLFMGSLMFTKYNIIKVYLKIRWRPDKEKPTVIGHN